MYFRITERQICLVERIASGQTLREAGMPYQLSPERVRQTVCGVCRKYLIAAKIDGTPETFYPGEDKEDQPVWSGWLDSYRTPDPTTRLTAYERSVAKGIERVHPEQAVYRVSVTTEDIRKEREYWHHQMTLVRHNLQYPPPKLVYQGTP